MTLKEFNEGVLEIFSVTKELVNGLGLQQGFLDISHRVETYNSYHPELTELGFAPVNIEVYINAREEFRSVRISLSLDVILDIREDRCEVNLEETGDVIENVIASTLIYLKSPSVQQRFNNYKTKLSETNKQERIKQLKAELKQLTK